MKMNAEKIVREYELVERILSAYLEEVPEKTNESMYPLFATGEAEIHSGDLLETFANELTSGNFLTEHMEDKLFATDVSFPGGSLEKFKAKCEAGDLKGENINRYLNRVEVECFMEENHEEVKIDGKTYTVYLA